MTDCIFCKIIAGEMPSHKVRENDDFLAILDVFPNTKGQTLVIAKDHYDSDILAIEDKSYFSKYLLAAQEVSQLLRSKLQVQRVWLIIEGMGVNHAHIKLYPMYGLEWDREEFNAKDKIFFEKYEWYLSTQMGEFADQNELAALANHIRN